MSDQRTETSAEVVRRAFEVFRTHGMRAGVESGYAPDVVFVDLPEFPDGGEHHGREATLAHLEQFFGAWEQPLLELIDIADAGDRATVHFRLTGTGRSSGVGISIDLWHVCTVRDGAITRVEAYSEEQQARAAAG